jgi:[acyl-carrier-protein] S-malonyltransferase
MCKIAFVFPGQGAQYTGMGKDIIDNFQESKDLFIKANDVLDFDLEKLCFEDTENINNTAYTQPALLAISIAILKAVESIGIRPNYVAGLSLGEYTALVANKSIDYLDAIKLVRKRGIYMEEAAKQVKGGMAAIIGSDKNTIKDICNNIDGILEIANYNSPKQIVIAGEVNALEKGIDEMTEKGIKAIPLKVSGAFHSSLMETASEKLQVELDSITINNPKIPYSTNVTGDIINENSNIKKLLVKQVKSSVRWEDSIVNLINEGVDTFIEIGPGRTLTGLIKKINRKIKVINVENMETLYKLKDYVEGKNE